MQYVITLVHGTWPAGLPLLARLRRVFAPREPTNWTDADSDLTRHLVEHLTINQTSAIIRPFRWSGKNSVGARLLAADALDAHLHQISSEFPGARQIAIGHSHGGSVLMYALLRPGVAELLAGVVCLATPFIHLSPKPKEAPSGPFFAFASLVLLGVLLLLGLTLYILQVPGLLSLLIAAVVGYLLPGLERKLSARLERLTNGVQHAAERVRVACELPSPELAPTLLIRGDGDEASGILAAGSFVTEMTMRPWLRLHAWANEPKRRSHEFWVKHEEWVKQGRPGEFSWWLKQEWTPGPASRSTRRTPPVLLLNVLRIAAAFAVAIACGWVVVVLFFDLIRRMESNPITLLAALFLVTFLMFWMTAIIFAIAGLWGHFVNWGAETLEYMGQLLALALWPIWSLFLLGFGWEIAVAGLFFDVFAESTPPGRWRLHHVSAPDHGSESVLRPMRHAFLHDDPRVFAAVVAWIQEH
jgi:hypothetical protein